MLKILYYNLLVGSKYIICERSDIMRVKSKIIFIALVIILIAGAVTYGFKSKKPAVTKKTQVEAKQQDNKKNKENQVEKNKQPREFKNTPLIYNDKSIPVLMYHSIDYEKNNELRLPKEQFRQQMKYLKDSGYTTLTLDELYNFMVNNKPVPAKSVVITLDDGYKDNYTNAYPVLKEFGLNAAVFVITSTIDKDSSYLTTSELKEMDQNGVDIESHTVNHDKLGQLSYEKQCETLKGSKEYIEKILNKKVKYIGYPFGKYNNYTQKAAKDTEYTMAFTTNSGWSNKDQGIYNLNRVYISANYSMDEFIRRITNPNYNVQNTAHKTGSKK